jgi:hypothetical protein
MKTWCKRIACWINKATNTHTLRIFNTHCFSTATMVAQKRFDVTLLFSLTSLRGFQFSVFPVLWPSLDTPEIIIAFLFYILYRTRGWHLTSVCVRWQSIAEGLVLETLVERRLVIDWFCPQKWQCQPDVNCLGRCNRVILTRRHKYAEAVGMCMFWGNEIFKENFGIQFKYCRSQTTRRHHSNMQQEWG